MRISTANAYDASVDSLTARSRDLSDAQERISSLKRVNKGSDDPSAAARAERALANIERTAASQRAVDASLTKMTLAESALGDAGSLLQGARETLLAAGNATYSDAERRALADKLRGIRDQLLAVANRDDGAGNYLFGGQGSGTPPFVDAAGGVQYRGAEGQTRAADGEGMPLALDGAATWLKAPSGNGSFVTSASGGTGAWIDSGRVVDPSSLTGASYSIAFASDASGTRYSVLRDGVATAQTDVPFVSGQAIEIEGMSVTVTGAPANGDSFGIAPSTQAQSIFDVLDRAVTALETPNRSDAQIRQANTFAVRDIDSSMERLQKVRSEAGTAMNRLEDMTGRLQSQSLAQKTVRSQAEDLDMVEAVSDFQNRQTGYDAALKAYSMVQRLSLFDYVQF